MRSGGVAIWVPHGDVVIVARGGPRHRSGAFLPVDSRNGPPEELSYCRCGASVGAHASVASLDRRVLLNNNDERRVAFTQSARKHKIGRARVLHVLANPVVVDRIEESGSPRVRLLIPGADHTGRVIEVVAVQEDDMLVVIHAMDIRLKFRALYEEGLGHG